MNARTQTTFLMITLILGTVTPVIGGFHFVFAQTQTEEPPDTQPPVLSQQDDIIVEATSGLGAIVKYVTPPATDNVGIVSGPTCSPQSGSTFALGSSLVTCSAVDAVGNVGSITFTVTVQDTTAPSIIAPADTTVEALSSSASVFLGTPVVSDVVDPFPVITNDAPEIFPVGSTTITWTTTDFSGNSASAIQVVSTTDTTPPAITAEFAPMKIEEDEGIFTIKFNAIDKVDPSPVTIADVNGVSVTNGQTVKLEIDDKESESNISGGLLEIEAPSFVLTVTSTDASGNQATISVTAKFEAPVEMLPPELITIEDLQALLLELESLSPDEIKNLGEQVSKFLFLSKILFDQEKLQLKELQKEFLEQINSAPPEERKELRKELKETIKDRREEFKDLRDRWKELFGDFRDKVKEILKENNDVASRQIKQEVEKIKLDFETKEEKIKKGSDEEERILKQNEKMKKEELIKNLFSRLAILENDDSKKRELMTMLDLKKAEFEFKDIKDFQKVLKESLKENERDEKKLEELKDELEDKIKKINAEEEKISEKSRDEISALHKKLDEKWKLDDQLRTELEKEEKKLKDELEKEEKKLKDELSEEKKKLKSELEKNASESDEKIKEQLKKLEEELKQKKAEIQEKMKEKKTEVQEKIKEKQAEVKEKQKKEKEKKNSSGSSDSDSGKSSGDSGKSGSGKDDD